MKKIIFYLIAVIALSATGLTGDLVAFLPVGILMVSIIGAVISLLSGLFTRRFKSARSFGLLIAISLPAMILDTVILAREREKVEKSATQVITAIERYQAAHGALPASLDRLVPEQLAQVPTARKGRKFMYRPTADGYSLSFSMPVMMVRTYDSKERKWSSRD